MAIDAVTQPDNGTVEVAGDNQSLTYKPDADYCNDGNPTDNFTYTLNGGSTATVAVTVNCADDGPTAVNDTATVAEDDPATDDRRARQRHRHRRRPEGDRLGHPARRTATVAGGRRQPEPHLRARRRLLQRRRPDRQLHLHPQRRLDGDGRGDGELRRRRPDRRQRHRDGRRGRPGDPIDVLANDTDTDGGPKAIDAVTQPDDGTVAGGRRQPEPHLQARRRLLQRRQTRPTTSPTPSTAARRRRSR